MNLDLDSRIDAEHAAAQRAEDDAVRITQRLRLIPGIDAWLGRHKRNYGQAPNPWGGSGNLTAQALILRADPALARHLAGLAGASLPAPNYAQQAAAEQRNAQLRRMEAKTEELRQRNAARMEQQDRARRFGTWNPMLGKVV